MKTEPGVGGFANQVINLIPALNKDITLDHLGLKSIIREANKIPPLNLKPYLVVCG